MIEIKDLNKTYHLKTGDVEAIKNVSLKINDGEIYGVIGYSGAGKSSLVRCLNLLEVPDSGSITVNDQKLTWIENGEFQRLSDHELKTVRKGIGMIFQHFNLLDRSTVFDNVAYPLKYCGKKKEKINARVRELLELVGLTDKIDVYPSQLSGGQKQRVAIARALANNPKVLLSDEATSALDPEATESILNLLKDLNKKLNLTIVLITHEMAVIKSICHKVAVMEKGRVVEEGLVYDIFSNPQADITKKFIASQSSLSKITKLLEEDSSLVQTGENGRLIRLQFEGQSTGKAAVSDISRRFGVNVNIVLANIDILQAGALGNLIVVINGEAKAIEDAIAYLNEHKVKVIDINK